MPETTKIFELPEIVPVLPVRNTVLFPNAAIPLMVGRDKSIAAIEAADREDGLILVVAQRDGNIKSPRTSDLYRVGVICTINKITKIDSDGYQLIANGQFRFRITDYLETNGYFAGRGHQIAEVAFGEPHRIETLGQRIRELGRTILKLAAIPGAESLMKLFNQLSDPGQIADLCATFLQLPVPTKQELLEEENIERRLNKLLELMMKEKDRLTLQNEIQSKMMERLSKDQRNQLLREQMRTIRDELGDDTDTTQEYAEKIEKAGLPEEVEKIAQDELNRLSMVQRSSPEYQVIRNYLDWIVALPWDKSSASSNEDIELDKARQILNEGHHGIDKVKKRIVQFLAVTKLKKNQKGPILCLAGPPGVGKTSMGKSIAKALGREFIRTSLGGVRDEAEIRGHRRTYIGSMPGRIIQSLKRVGVNDPVIMFDEIDKLGADFRGDPASAMLEVLDPEQNAEFTDHYMDVPFDLSNVFFITTANVLDQIPAPLRDRMEIIEMTSYSKQEKVAIAERHLIPSVVQDHGITATQIEIPRKTVEAVISRYTREAGVRTLNRKFAAICRHAAELIADNKAPEKIIYQVDDLENVLGPRRFFDEKADDRLRPGVSTGLAWTAVGGEILKIEITKMDGKGGMLLTGQLGDVMKESAQIALSLLRASAGKTLRFDFDKTDFHLHVPSGAIPKDGPSAGTAIFLAMGSLLLNKPLNPKLAVTGEITLRGNVLPVGGIKEKVVAAHRAGIEEVCLPEHNRGDLADVTEDVKKQLKFHFVKDVFDLLKIAQLPLKTDVGAQGVEWQDVKH